MSEYIEAFLKRINKLDSIAGDPKMDRQAIRNEIANIRQWLTGNRSLQQHRMAFAFFNYLYNAYGDEYSSFEDYLDGLKYAIGYCTVKTTESTIHGERVKFRKFKPKSLSFGKCSAKTFSKIFDKIKELSFARYGINFLDWEKEYNANTNTI